MSAIRPPRCWVNGLWIAAALTSACATQAVPESRPQLPEHASAPTVPVTRHGRYALVELTPEPAQRNLMRQIVEVSIPPTLDASVGDALRHVLQRSGYRLCNTPTAAALYALPLPAAHLHLGPMTLRHGLLTLAGPAWDLAVDDVSRQVCFKRRTPDIRTPLNAPGAKAAEAWKVQP
ncbi:MAG: PilL N-terminal domain-containing protein [Azoarcus sp.]|jgi:type IV pili sensor histidine kinase/response regulator|nr:PilL N-terminal domain-containing protein [Azoarcus sp.]